MNLCLSASNTAVSSICQQYQTDTKIAVSITWIHFSRICLQNPVADIMDHLWDIIEPLLFGLIGTEINIDHIKLEVLGLGIGVLGFSLFVSTYFSSLIAFLFNE